MPRRSRQSSSTGMYHATIRGVDRLPIFDTNHDSKVFISEVASYKDICGFKLHALVLMNNHAHFLIQEEDIPLGKIFQQILGSYAIYFNHEHDRVGHQYQSRFWSKPVEDLEYYFKSMWYIYQNPVKIGICSHPQDYTWSTLNEDGPLAGLVDNEILRFLPPDPLYRLYDTQLPEEADAYITALIATLGDSPSQTRASSGVKQFHGKYGGLSPHGD